MDREDFMDIVYSELESDSDNNRANRIIDATDEYMSAQLKPHYDEWCIDCKEYDKEKHSCPRWNRMIRQTLQDAQPELCEDAVSRTEVLRMINCINDHHTITPYKSVGAVTEHLTRIANNLPPVTPKQPEQRTGKWIKITNTLYKCDRCGAVQLKGNYCKDCGAKMEGEENV